jgi:(1->4)-alpha-D-glucan 1-alpha-D-glucosylmutase
MLQPPSRIPRATYRLQLNSDFPFDAARKLIPYLKQLGISELYASPIFQASAGSTHGYDVNDYNRISTDLGGRDALNRLSNALHQESLGLLVDFVPNHMGINGEYNHWWHHLLENGANSRYAAYFDIEWHPRLDRLYNRVLVPMLGDHYGTVLERGGMSLHYDQGQFTLYCGTLKFPIRPGTYSLILNQVDALLPSGDARKAQLREWGEKFEGLPWDEIEAREEQLKKLKQEFAVVVEKDQSLRQLLDTALKKINGIPGEPASFEILHDVLERQHYRLAHWKVGAHEVNYRRFFAVDTLIGLKMEDGDVFTATHALLAELVGTGIVTGIRLDHIDGLWNPVEYLERLRSLVGSRRHRETIYTLVEKILAADEKLPEPWAVHGTTGYEFTASLNDLLLDRADEPAWTELYGKFTGNTETSLDETYDSKLFILQEMFPNALANLSVELDALIEPDWHWRDVSLHDLKTALRHLLACLPLYRTYRMLGKKMVASEKAAIVRAIEEGIRRNPCVDPQPIRFLGRILTGDYPADDASAETKDGFARWVCKLQQVTGAIMAKSVEDTHFFRYVRLMGANEVGSHPSRFGQPVAAFHEANIQRQKETPFCLLTTSTHDTKMSEDARARLLALAELPEEWAAHLETWHNLNREARQEIEGRAAPDHREEYLLYQALLAAWPLGATHADDEFLQRMKAYLNKAQGEAKLNTAWTYPHEKWLAASASFIEAILRSPPFLKSFLPFAQRVAHRGMIFSLTQTLLKITVPGVPDIYQGNEIWDFSLVDPDNRRAVDYDLREKLLTGLDNRSPSDLLKNWADGGIKMRIIQSLLRCRAENPELFQQGDYIPIELEGEKADHFVAFLRRLGSTELLVIAPRRLGDDDLSLDSSWKDTRVVLSKPARWKNLLTGAEIETSSDGAMISNLLFDLPIAALLS